MKLLLDDKQHHGCNLNANEACVSTPSGAPNERCGSAKKKGHKKKRSKKRIKKKVPPPHTPEEEEEEEEFFMVVFEDFWSLVANRGRVAHFYRMECESLWKDYTPAQQQAICDTIAHKLRTGAFVHFVPTKAMQDNVPKTFEPSVMSFDEYYRTFHTTTPQNGWVMQNPTGNQVIYVKQ